MRKLLTGLTALCLTMSLATGASAVNRTEFDVLNGSLNSSYQVSVEDSVISAAITFTNVSQSRECTLRWYLDDVLCGADASFLLEEGAVAELECSLHFGDQTRDTAALWVEITANDDPDLTASFTRRIFVRGFEQPPEDVDSSTYQIDVLRDQCAVIVYQKDENGNYTDIANAFVCSPGLNNWTITGWYGAYGRWPWLDLLGGVSGQYTTQIHGDFLFHTVPYMGRYKDGLELEEYNKLGEPASMGCIRMAVCDAKWIYDHCPSGTDVHLYDTDEIPVVKPVAIKLNADTFTGWDPTDPDPANPTKAETYPRYELELRPAAAPATQIKAQ